MQFSDADIVDMVSAFGEQVAITPAPDNWTLFGPVTINAVFNVVNEVVTPLDGERQRVSYSLLCAESAVVGVDVNCTATVRGKVHNVLAVVPDSAGFAFVQLGDPQ